MKIFYMYCGKELDEKLARKVVDDSNYDPICNECFVKEDDKEEEV